MQRINAAYKNVKNTDGLYTHLNGFPIMTRVITCWGTVEESCSYGRVTEKVGFRACNFALLLGLVSLLRSVIKLCKLGRLDN